MLLCPLLQEMRLARFIFMTVMLQEMRIVDCPKHKSTGVF